MKESNERRFFSWAELWGHTRSYTLCGKKRLEVRIKVPMCEGANDWLGQLGTCRKKIEISRQRGLRERHVDACTGVGRK